MRLLAAFLVIGLCGVAVFRGVQTASFAAATLDPYDGQVAAGDFAKWHAVPGISSAALKETLASTAHAVSPDEARQRTAILTKLLAASPLSAGAWLSLAGTRAADGALEPHIEAALNMSYLSSPNEGEIMLQRGIFGLLRWDTLGSPLHDRIARDLAGGLYGVNDNGLRVIKTVLAPKTPQDRGEITTLLQEHQVASAVLRELGLQAAPPPAR